MNVLPGLLMLTAVQPVAAGPVEVSVGRLSQQLEAFDGRMVRVRGWLWCGHWGCRLRARPGSPANGNAGEVSSLAIGENEAMAPSLGDAAGHQIVLEGRVSAACRREICTDHAPELMPTRILRIFGAPRAIAEDH